MEGLTEYELRQRQEIIDDDNENAQIERDYDDAICGIDCFARCEENCDICCELICNSRYGF